MIIIEVVDPAADLEAKLKLAEAAWEARWSGMPIPESVASKEDDEEAVSLADQLGLACMGAPMIQNDKLIGLALPVLDKGGDVVHTVGMFEPLIGEVGAVRGLASGGMGALLWLKDNLWIPSAGRKYPSR